MSRHRIDFIRVMAVSALLIAVAYYYLNLFSPQRIPLFLRIGVLRKPVNVLIIGSDITYNAETRKPMPEVEGRADTILLARFDPAGRHKLGVLSIPRDTYAAIPGYGKNKINAANVLGGVSLTKKTVSDLTGQDIDYFIEFKPNFLVKLVDLLGGVSLNVEKDMQYTDRAQGLNINLKQGWKRLSGKQAQDYIRFRYDLEGDWGRIRRQQQFLKALKKSLAKPTNIVKLPFAIRSILSEVKTDLPLSCSIRLANSARMFAAEDIQTITATGEETYLPNVGAVLIPNKNIFEKTIKELF